MPEPVRVGFIGCGGHASQNLYPAFRLGSWGSPRLKEPLGELVACCDLKKDLAERNAKVFGFQRSYTNHREMLEKEDLDAVFVIMHPRDQPKVAIDVLRAGKPVFVEKPASVTIADSIAMKEAAEKARQWVMIAFMKRFSTPYLRARKLIEDARFGPITTYESRYCYGKYAAFDVYDFINGFSCHFLDLARFFMGDVKSVYAAYASRAGTAGGRPKAYPEVTDPRDGAVSQEESWIVTFHFESGCIGSLQTNCLERLGERVQVTGRGSFVEVTNWREIRACLGDPEEVVTWEPNETMVNDAMDLRTFHGYTGEVTHFLECARDGRTPSVTIDDGIAQLRIEQACKKSALSGRVVEVAGIPAG